MAKNTIVHVLFHHILFNIIREHWTMTNVRFMNCLLQMHLPYSNYTNYILYILLIRITQLLFDILISFWFFHFPF